MKGKPSETVVAVSAAGARRAGRRAVLYLPTAGKTDYQEVIFRGDWQAQDLVEEVVAIMRRGHAADHHRPG
ncbi:MAG: hypothetical protein U0401_09590 [Anaerolineae bacterium]